MEIRWPRRRRESVGTSSGQTGQWKPIETQWKSPKLNVMGRRAQNLSSVSRKGEKKKSLWLMMDDDGGMKNDRVCFTHFILSQICSFCLTRPTDFNNRDHRPFSCVVTHVINSSRLWAVGHGVHIKLFSSQQCVRACVHTHALEQVGDCSILSAIACQAHLLFRKLWAGRPPFVLLVDWKQRSSKLLSHQVVKI